MSMDWADGGPFLLLVLSLLSSGSRQWKLVVASTTLVTVCSSPVSFLI